MCSCMLQMRSNVHNDVHVLLGRCRRSRVTSRSSDHSMMPWVVRCHIDKYTSSSGLKRIQALIRRSVRSLLQLSIAVPVCLSYAVASPGVGGNESTLPQAALATYLSMQRQRRFAKGSPSVSDLCSIWHKPNIVINIIITQPNADKPRTSAVIMPFRPFVQTPIFSVSPSSLSLSPIFARPNTRTVQGAPGVLCSLITVASHYHLAWVALS